LESEFIKDEVEQFAYNHTTPETEIFRRLRDETYRDMEYAQMQVGRLEGQFLKMLVRLIGAGRVLEIGMFTGYSGLMMAEGLPEDGQLITCDINPKAQAVASRYFAESPHGRKIEIRMGPALDTIRTLEGPFDMVFIDADKGNYSNYYDAVMPLVRPGGLIAVDNVLWSGRVVNPEDDETRAIVAFDDKVQADPRVDNVCLTVRDGVMLIWKKR
jgi:caffeoyl-CoA O-methyltransferase